MAATGYTPLSIYYSATGAAVPVNTNLVSGELAINIADGKLYYKDSLGAVKLLASNAGSLGDVVGPASATDTAIATFDGTTGKLIKNNSAVTIGTTGNTVISVTDNTNAALRITQLGTGNALLVEDSTNPDASPFVIDANGQVGIGVAPSAGENLHIAKTVTGATTANVVINDGAVQSDVTASVRMFHTNPSIAAASFNLTTLTHFSANQGTKGAGATITSQIGFYGRNTLTAATTNYSFFSELVANNTTPGSIDRWSFYSGTAPSYLGGDVLLNGKLSLGTATTANYGTSGQVLTSAGSGASPTWTTPTGITSGKAIVMAMVFGL